MRSSTSSPILSFLSLIVGIFLLIYFWIPLLVILFVGFFIYVIVILIMARISGKSPNFNIKVVNIKRSQDPSEQNPFEQTNTRTDNIDYIDSTTVEKEEKK